MAPTKDAAACPFKLPRKYNFLKVLVENQFGMVVKCFNVEAKKTVVIKFPKYRNFQIAEEFRMMRKTNDLNLDKHSIVKFFDSFESTHGKALVFEPLDMSLHDFMKKRSNAPMLLSDIRTIIQQMATALDGLKKIHVIHADVKLQNIMMVNHRRRPFEVKLIDFGLAMPTSKAEWFRFLQPVVFRSPEILLGYTLSEATDMWSLGCAMFQMICGHRPFSGETEIGVFLSIVELVGEPADDVLVASTRRGLHYERFWNYRHKIYSDCYIGRKRAPKSHNFQSLDDLKVMQLKKNNKTEAIEREQCMELLKAMLKVDPRERITPREVLSHPFITKDYPKTSRRLSEDFQREPPIAPLKDEDSINIQPDGCSPSPEILPSAVILVRSASTENTTLLEDQESAASEPPTAPLKDDDSINIQPDGCSPSPEILPSAVILVQPATTENTTLLEDQEIPVSFQSGLNKRSESSVSSADSKTKISEDSTTCEDTGTQKKKNCFRRTLFWLRKTFSCRVPPIV